MEPVCLTVGALGLAGLFSSCLDIIEQAESWRNFVDDLRLLGACWEAECLCLETWGRAIGFDNGTPSRDHYEALDNPQISFIVRIYPSIIEDPKSMRIAHSCLSVE